MACLALRAWEPSQVNYINAHATSTLVGDVAELNAMKKVFKDTKDIKINATKVRPSTPARSRTTDPPPLVLAGQKEPRGARLAVTLSTACSCPNQAVHAASVPGADPGGSLAHCEALVVRVLLFCCAAVACSP